MQKANPRHWILMVAILFIAPVFAGCFGDDAPDAGGAGDEGGVEVREKKGGSDDKKEQVSNNTDHSGAKNEPSAHFHHYWGDPPADSVLIYNGKVPFRNYDNKFVLTHNTLAWAQFGLEDDKDDVNFDDDQNPSPVGEDGVADTVFAGTNRLEVKFPDSFPPGVSEMRFQYKPANSPIFLPESGGIQVIPGQTEDIHLNEVGMTDPPHQFTTSRWQFRLFASSTLCSQFGLEEQTCPPTVITQADVNPEGTTKYNWGKRDAGLEIIAHNGGTKALDPPHPDFWKGDETIDLGDDTGEVADPAILTPLLRERVNQLTEISMPPNKIVPLGTDQVEVRVKWENEAGTQEAADTYLKLYYHGADTIEYTPAEYDGQDGDWHVYRIYDKDGSKVDPPYESNSFWRFKLVPTMDVQGEEQENMGVFQGTWWVEFKAHKKEGFVLE